MKITGSLRAKVAQRAGFRCEYCLTSEADSVVAFEVDHIFPLKHGGPTLLGNLAYCCFICNRNKGSNLATANYPTWRLIPLFNPRIDHWTEHFQIVNGVIQARTEIGQATIKVLDLNHVDRIIERRLQIESGTYPNIPTSD